MIVLGNPGRRGRGLLILRGEKGRGVVGGAMGEGGAKLVEGRERVENRSRRRNGRRDGGLEGGKIRGSWSIVGVVLVGHSCGDFYFFLSDGIQTMGCACALVGNKYGEPLTLDVTTTRIAWGMRRFKSFSIDPSWKRGRESVCADCR